MKYRIKSLKRINENGEYEVIHVPQKKYRFWPFWMCFDLYNYGAYKTAQFDSFKEAEDYLKKRKTETDWQLNGRPIEK